MNHSANKTDIPTILIADDSPTALKVTSSVLNRYGYNVIQVMDGEQAIIETYRHKPSAVVVDLKMPKKDGYEVCREIKKDTSFFIPILLLTAREDIESLVKGLESGADDYIIKPFNEMEFIARIKVMLRLKKLNDNLIQANKKLQYLSTHDELTGLYNHRYFISVLEKLVKQSKRDNSNLCLAIFDIDFFKNINDSYGHLEGDKVLKRISHFLSDSFTTDTIIARYGGEEFIALFPDRQIDFAITVSQKVIDDCPKITFQSDDNTKYHISLSAGISSTNTIKSFNSNELIQSADKLLYNSKNTGRNRLSYIAEVQS